MHKGKERKRKRWISSWWSPLKWRILRTERTILPILAERWEFNRLRNDEVASDIVSLKHQFGIEKIQLQLKGVEKSKSKWNEVGEVLKGEDVKTVLTETENELGRMEEITVENLVGRVYKSMYEIKWKEGETWWIWRRKDWRNCIWLV